jgi:hypothetical protein
VIRSVLSMVDTDIDSLPSKSTAANITSELGLVARQHLTEEMNNITDCTMLRVHKILCTVVMIMCA